MKFIKTTIIGGLIFLIPVGLLSIIVGKVFGMMMAMAQPMAVLLPIKSLGGIATANILAILGILAVCFFAGLIARTGPAERLLAAAESAILQKIPGYTILKGLTSTMSPDQEDRLKPVVVTMNSSARLGLEVDRLSGCRVVVYIPGAPNTWYGAVHLVEKDRVEYIDKPMTEIIEHTEQLGRNAGKVLEGTSFMAQRGIGNEKAQ